jgi:eukaryotic-like serine/threonine-protein kinase
MSLSAGARLGPYEILAPLGAGGMGEVYRARDTRLDRTVAIKVVSSVLAGAPELSERFDREARVISALSHPHICPLFDVGHQDGVDFLVMEYLDGETLEARLKTAALPLNEILTLAIQIASALDAAHRAGVVHRDLKPGNVMITKSGAKLLDFGLAKTNARTSEAAGGSVLPTAAPTLTGQGMFLGTIPYMSPEQLRGLPVDSRTDLFSLGVVLYEMVTRQRPFAGSSAIAVADAILHQRPSDFGDKPAPGKLKSLIGKLLEKDPASRYGTAEEVHRELTALDVTRTPTRSALSERKTWIAVGISIVVASVAVGWSSHRFSRERWALRTAAPEVARLLDVEEVGKAAKLLREARAVLPNDPALEKLWIRSTGDASVESVPSGADVSIQPYGENGAPWEAVGKTPLKAIRVPNVIYVWRIIKPGFAPAFFIDGTVLALKPGGHYSIDQKITLRPEESVPPEMVVVSGDEVRLGYPHGQAPRVRIEDFLIDRHEVTNEEYKRFVDAGGYQKREFWTQPFVRDGRAIRWEEAVALFRDATGRPGPATWEAGSYPRGLEKHPVSGVSWYEAAAFAAFAGKSLPTVYHWTQASQSYFTALIADGSNFGSAGAQQVGGRGTLSGFGTTDMAGNVKEWCLNEDRDGKRFTLGGGFGDPKYMFNFTDAQRPWDRRPNFGFRCVKLDFPPGPGATARIEAPLVDLWNDKPVSDDVFNAFKRLYAYDKSELSARVEQTEEMQNWKWEKVSFDAAYGHERVLAHLFLPRNVSAPFQVVLYFPGADAMSEEKLDLSRVEDGLDFIMKSGRALMVPIYKGFYERRDGLRPGGKPPAFFRDHVINFSKDLSRSLDYLETRHDIDNTRMAYFGFSMGGSRAPVLLAVESRFKAAILSSGGFELRHDLPEVDAINFAPRVKVPVLMLNGRYDDGFPVASSQLPLFRFLGTPDTDKKHVIYEAGHGDLPHREEVRESLDWLDKYLGPVRH